MMSLIYEFSTIPNSQQLILFCFVFLIGIEKLILKTLGKCNGVRTATTTMNRKAGELGGPLPWLAAGGGTRPGVTVKDGSQQMSVRALAAVLDKPKAPEWRDTAKLAKHEELAPYDENWFHPRAASTALHLSLPGCANLAPRPRCMGDIRETASLPVTSAKALRVWPTGSSKS